MPALGPRVRELIDDLAVKGLFDVDASLQLSEATGNELLCRATVDWHDGSVQPRRWPYPLRDVHGQLWMDQATRRIEIRQVSGRNGPARVRLDGTIDLKDGTVGQLHAAVDDLPLDEPLYQALPPDVQGWWRAFEPKGQIGVRSDMTFAQRPAGESTVTHRTSLLLAGNEICWDVFPLPLKELNGKVLLTAGSCELQDLTATHGGGQVRLGGTVDWGEASTRARLKVSVRDLPLDEPLRLAVPWQIRRQWNLWQPAGRVDVDLSSLRYQEVRGAGTTWDLEGTLGGRLQKVDMSVPVTDAVARTTIAAHIDQERGTFEGKGRLEADRAVLSLIPVTDGRAEWVREADGALRVRDLQAQALGARCRGSWSWTRRRMASGTARSCRWTTAIRAS